MQQPTTSPVIGNEAPTLPQPYKLIDEYLLCEWVIQGQRFRGHDIESRCCDYAGSQSVDQIILVDETCREKEEGVGFVIDRDPQAFIEVCNQGFEL